MLLNVATSCVQENPKAFGAEGAVKELLEHTLAPDWGSAG